MISETLVAASFFFAGLLIGVPAGFYLKELCSKKEKEEDAYQ